MKACGQSGVHDWTRLMMESHCGPSETPSSVMTCSRGETPTADDKESFLFLHIMQHHYVFAQRALQKCPGAHIHCGFVILWHKSKLHTYTVMRQRYAMIKANCLSFTATKNKFYLSYAVIVIFFYCFCLCIKLNDTILLDPSQSI